MPYAIKHTPKAETDFLALPKQIQQRISRWYTLLQEDPRRVQTKQLTGHPELRRVHASKDYVIVYTIKQSELIVLIVRIGHRREIYRRL